MVIRLSLFSTLLSVLLLASITAAQQPEKAVATSESSSSPEMNRLAKALAGDWNTTETMERGDFFPNGGSRHGIAHVRLGTGGTTLIDEVHSDGSAGKLDGLLVIWWDKAAKLYRFFTCFNGYDHPCKMRGTAHWQGDTLVEDYEEMVHGRKTKSRDSFIDITPTSHTLVWAVAAADGTMKPVVTTKSVRR